MTYNMCYTAHIMNEIHKDVLGYIPWIPVAQISTSSAPVLVSSQSVVYTDYARNGKVKCQYCAMWGAVESNCDHCGAPIS